MQVVFEHSKLLPPKVSIILLDWSCRQSFHTLHYLNNQTVPREEYEVIWIEYYSRQAPEIEAGLKECENQGQAPIVDKWIVMGTPDNVYYHKHLMYNLGIITGRGRIITICDSDAIMSPSFVESIIDSFAADPDIVLHLDEVRNNDRRFHPFNYPTIEEITGKGCINWQDGKTTGLLDKEDPLHTMNYGACMCALREDLINIGGADEHIDYLGHICGPYDMTFRLLNAGKKEVWHQEEFLYHVWHPGSDGVDNYLGPHDGRNMSTTALNTRRTDRVMPLVENSVIRMLRSKQDDIIYVPLLLQAIPEKDIKGWTPEKLKQQKKSAGKREEFFVRHPLVSLRLLVIFIKMFVRHFHLKLTQFSRQPKSLRELGEKIYRVYGFLRNMSRYYNHILERCRECLTELASDNVKEIAVYGAGDVADVLYELTLSAPVKIHAVYDKLEGKRFFKFNVRPVEAIKTYKGKVVVATLVGVEANVEMLKEMGVEAERIVCL